jgi:SAM-dependent methyltransferase
LGSSSTANSRDSAASRSRAGRYAPASTKKCDLCAASDFEIVAQQDRRGQPLATVVCKSCGLVMHEHVPGDEELAEFYASDYRRQYNGETTPSSGRLVRAWNNALRIYRQLEKFVQRGDQVFEVGAGIGCNVKVFEQRGCQASGIEPFEGFREFGRGKLYATLYPGDLSRLPSLPPQDLVLLVHVIEHLNAPTHSLQTIRKLLKPRGRLYIECPNLAAPFARRSQLFHFAHIYNFTPDTLAMLGEKCGFEVEQTFSGPGDPNLRMLLRRCDNGRLAVRSESYGISMAALDRYNNYTYHLRWSYLRTRCEKLLSYANEQLFAWRDARRIIARCQAAEQRRVA